LTATAVGSFFPPGRIFFELGPENFSPGLLRKITYLGGNCTSFNEAQRALAETLEITLSGRHIETLTERVGRELAAERDHLAQLWEQHQLPQPTVANAPEAVAVAVDDGKLHTRGENQPPGVYAPQWKNDKIACLMNVLPQWHAQDPMPNPPPAFTHRNRVEKLVAELGHVRSSPKQPLPLPAEPSPDTPKPKKDVPKKHLSPDILVRSCIATHTQPDAFGAMVASEAHLRRFYEAKEAVFLGDGSPGNWTLQELYFPEFLPLLDVVHLIEHLFAAAKAGHHQVEWPLYLRLLRAAWAGKPDCVVSLLNDKANLLGPPSDTATEDDPRQVVAKTIGYVSNNRMRMDYPRARRIGLPITTSHVESLINTFNFRVKAAGKFWCPANAEAILQVRAARLSQTNRWDEFWDTRGTRSCGRIRAPRAEVA
jgi:hypothetical protein